MTDGKMLIPFSESCRILIVIYIMLATVSQTINWLVWLYQHVTITP